MSIWVKICGITRSQDAQAAVKAGADAIGVNFCPASVRLCDEGAARAIVEAVPPDFPVYGVFAGAPRERIEATVSAVGLRGVQLHGGEPEGEAMGWSLPVIRAVFCESRSAVAGLLDPRPYRVLLDAPFGGGSGKRIDAALIEGVDLSEVIVAGGLDPDNVGGLVRSFRPWGVDCASGVESAPGIKDAALMERFVANARSS